MSVLLRLALFFFPLCLFSLGYQEIPVLYKGRIRPVEAYSRVWLYDLYHAQSLKNNKHDFFVSDPSAALFLFHLLADGPKKWVDSPLFYIQSRSIKEKMGLNLKPNRFSYNSLSQSAEIPPELIGPLSIFRGLDPTPLNTDYKRKLDMLSKTVSDPAEKQKQLEREFPIRKRLREAGTLFFALPGRSQNDWYSLKALELEVYSPSTNTLLPIENFTLYSKENFERIRTRYWDWKKDSNNPTKLNQLGLALITAYQSIEGEPYRQAHDKSLTYPSLNRLKAEVIYYHYPWVRLLIMGYLVSLITLLFYFFIPRKGLWILSNFFLGLTFTLHSLLILLRVYILNRPPVATMFETVVYVPWIGVLSAWLIDWRKKNPFLLMAACLIALILLIILELTEINQGLDNVQAVLDSQFWLVIHVLMIVASYGVFILGGILGHFYLIGQFYQKPQSEGMRNLAEGIKLSLYTGLALLIPGTILGGVWAAESWGRFWDWDPKESWAFISICFYLIGVHAYRYRIIGNYGLAIISIVGLLAISFTWYGVNFILGTGLHSYGFGSGGEFYYYLFVIAESLFLLYSVQLKAPNG